MSGINIGWIFAENLNNVFNFNEFKGQREHLTAAQNNLWAGLREFIGQWADWENSRSS